MHMLHDKESWRGYIQIYRMMPRGMLLEVVVERYA